MCKSGGGSASGKRAEARCGLCGAGPRSLVQCGGGCCGPGGGRVRASQVRARLSRAARRRARTSPRAAPPHPRRDVCSLSERRLAWIMDYHHPQPLQPLGPPAPPPQLLPPAPPPPLPSLPSLQHGHDDDRWSQYHIWRQHVFVNGQSTLCVTIARVMCRPCDP